MAIILAKKTVLFKERAVKILNWIPSHKTNDTRGN